MHSRGMTESLTVCALDERGVVTAIRRLAPERVVSFPTTGWLLEVPTRSLAPAVGSELTVVLPKQTESTPSAPL